jgi:hypothetical protein
MLNHKNSTMKKAILCMIIMAFAVTLHAQKDPVSAVFDKYAGKEGFVAVNITGDMLKMFAQMEEQRRDTTFISKMTGIKILATEKSCDKPVVDFIAEVYDKLDKSAYKELMSVKEEDEDVYILAKESSGRISELLIVVSGKDDNALIQMKGDILLRELGEMAEAYDIKEFKHLKNFNK